MTGIEVTLGEVAASLGLIAVAIAVSLWQRTGLEGDIAVAVGRSFVQLTAMGYVVKVVFESDALALVIALITGMAVVGAWTGRARARKVPGPFLPLLAALLVAGAATLGLVVALGIFPAETRYLVPVGGMVVGTAMTAAAVALNRLGDDVTGQAREIEATLALGATGAEAVRPVVRRSLGSGVIALVDSTKTTGLIFFPGTMVGMLLAGADPVDAVRLQMVLLYVLLGGVSIAALIAVMLAQRRFFTPAQQLREPTPPAP